MREETFPVSRHASVAVIRLPAELDLQLADSVREALLTLINEGTRALVIDMTGTGFCDSAGMQALIRAHQRATANDTQLRVAVASPAVLRILELTAVDRLLDIHPDVPSAIASLSLPGQPATESLTPAPVSLVRTGCLAAAARR